MPITATEAKAFRWTEEGGNRLWDEKGMYLEARANGSKLWFLKYRFDGREKRLGLGSYHEVSLAAARRARDEARAAIQSGHDPLFERKMEKIERKCQISGVFQLSANCHECVNGARRGLELTAQHSEI